MSEALTSVRPGEQFRIREVPDAEVRAKLLRLGFLDGSVTCRRQLHNGPTVIRRNGTDLALGAAVAGDIEIE
ncbi:MAG: FeoA family protein [Halobacteriales archaeon]